MTKVNFLLAALCGLATLSASLAEPTMYGGAPAPPKYAAPPKYETPAPTPPKYQTPAPPKYEVPATTPPTPPKYETPATTTPTLPKYETPATPKYETPATPKYETPAPPKYETPAKYAEKKEEYPKMDGGMKYKRSIDEETEDAKKDTTEKTDMTAEEFSPMEIEAARDAVMKSLMTMIEDSVTSDDVENFGDVTEGFGDIADDEDMETPDGEEPTADHDEEDLSQMERSTPGDYKTASEDMGLLSSSWMKKMRLLISKRINARLNITGQFSGCKVPRPCIIRPIIVKKKIVRPVIVRKKIVRPVIVRKIVRPVIKKIVRPIIKRIVRPIVKRIVRPIIKKIVRPVIVRKIVRPIYKRIVICKPATYRKRCQWKRICY